MPCPRVLEDRYSHQDPSLDMKTAAICVTSILALLSIVSILLRKLDFSKKCVGWLSMSYSSNALGILITATIRQLSSILMPAALMTGSFLVYLMISEATPMSGRLTGRLDHPTNNIIAEITLRPESPSDLHLVLKFLFGVFAGVLASQAYSKASSLSKAIRLDAYDFLRDLNDLMFKNKRIGDLIGDNYQKITGNDWRECRSVIGDVVERMRKLLKRAKAARKKGGLRRRSFKK